MNFKFVKRGIVAVALLGAILLQSQEALAAEQKKPVVVAKQTITNEVSKEHLISIVPTIKKEKTTKLENIEQVSLNMMVAGKVFVSKKAVLSLPQESATIIGKVFQDSAVRVLESNDVWSKIRSGNVVGYVKTDSLITGEAAIAKAKEILQKKYPNTNISKLLKIEIENSFSVGETTQEESVRLAKEAAARKEASRQKGLEILNYAKRFLGNPYVYGGTSLTRGTDCSGFVRGVYRHFGVDMPHSSYGIRRVGRAVKYSEIQPGDIICYSGHVGIYAGNGKIINAIDENKGIGMSNARYKRIVTIRRVF